MDVLNREARIIECIRGTMGVFGLIAIFVRLGSTLLTGLRMVISALYTMVYIKG